MSSSIAVARTDEEILACFPVIRELRPYLDQASFLERVRRLMRDHRYLLVYLRDGDIKAVAGIRLGEWLYSGRYLEVEELVTTHTARSLGYGGALFDWVLRHAAEQQCEQVRLLSAVSRSDAHRFYARKGMSHDALYFAMDVPRGGVGREDGSPAF